MINDIQEHYNWSTQVNGTIRIARQSFLLKVSQCGIVRYKSSISPGQGQSNIFVSMINDAHLVPPNIIHLSFAAKDSWVVFNRPLCGEYKYTALFNVHQVPSHPILSSPATHLFFSSCHLLQVTIIHSSQTSLFVVVIFFVSPSLILFFFVVVLSPLTTFHWVFHSILTSYFPLLILVFTLSLTFLSQFWKMLSWK